MRYYSTRDASLDCSFKEAVLRGLSTEGGLFVPKVIPDVSPKLKDWSSLSYNELAVEIYSLFSEGSLSKTEVKTLIESSLSSFSHAEKTPLSKHESVYVLELFHGPTLSFKDIALQTLGQLFEWWPPEDGGRTILGATSGDTGSAAIYGVRGKKNIEAFILYPEGRISPLQELQMTTVEDENIHCLAVEGSFDDCQNMVKELFSDASFKQELGLSAVNSINWARITSQIVYYFYGYFRWLDLSKQTFGTELPCSVPTGNFGDILAGYIAKRMGLPLGKMIVASNDNDILTRFFETGKYQIEEVVTTISPAMDIQISSNFERLLFWLHDGDSAKISELMDSLKNDQFFQVSDSVHQKFKQMFEAERVNEKECMQTMRSFEREHQYIIDPHTAIGVAAGLRVLNDGQEFMSLSTAHPGKFHTTVEEALGRKLELPSELEALHAKESKKVIVPAVADAVKKELLKLRS